MKNANKLKEIPDQGSKEMFDVWGRFLFEARKSLGNKKAKLDEDDMFLSRIKKIGKDVPKS